MLAGEAVVAIWNGITEEAREDFFAWHNGEHMPERAGIPGFLRGRRYIAADPATSPEFFTLYEAASLPVLTGSDYADCLNHPTEATRRVTAQFRDTKRALARVIASYGPGVGGVLLAIGFSPETSRLDVLARLVAEAASEPRVVGAHLCLTDLDASGARSAESKDRSDITDPPGAIILIEATDLPALAGLFPGVELTAAGARQIRRGLYRLEYLRGKTAFSA